MTEAETPAQWEQRRAREEDWHRPDWGSPSLPADHPRIVRARRIGWFSNQFFRGARWGRKVAAGRRKQVPAFPHGPGHVVSVDPQGNGWRAWCLPHGELGTAPDHLNALRIALEHDPENGST